MPSRVEIVSRPVSAGRSRGWSRWFRPRAAELVGLEGHGLRRAGLVGDDQDDLARADARGGDLDGVLVDRGGQRDRGGRAQAVLARLGAAAAGEGEGTASRTIRRTRAETVPEHGRARKRRCTVRPARHAAGSMLEQAFATAEFLALDTETNGLAGDRCELTEIGAVLVGGGELHERVRIGRGRGASARARGSSGSPGSRRRWSTRRRRRRTCCREFERMLRGRVLVAHNASFDVRVLRQAFARAALEWPAPPVLCTVQLARRFAPLQRAPRARDARRRARGGGRRSPPRAAGRAHVRAGVLLAVRQAERQRARRSPTRSRCSARARSARAPPKVKRPRGERPHLAGLPHEPGVYIFRDADGRPLYVGKSVDLRTRARSHFTTGATWAADAEHVDHQVTESELGALLLEDRLIKALRPPGNVRGKTEPDGYVYLRCRLDIPFPILEVAREPAAGHAVCVGPVRGRGRGGRAGRAAQLPVRPAPLRAGAPAPRAPVGLRPDGPLPLALPERPGPEPLPRAARPGAEAVRGPRRRAALLARVDEQTRSPRRSASYERAAWLQRRKIRLEALLDAWAACCARPTRARGSCSRRTPEARGPLRRDLDRRRPGGRLGPACRARGADVRVGARVSRRAPRPGSSAAGCPRTRSRKRAWSACGSPPTARRRWSSGPGRGRRHTPPSSPGPVWFGVVVDSVNVSVLL